MHKHVNARAAAIGLHAMMDGLIINWLLHPADFSLKKEGGSMLDTYLRGLGADIPVETKRLRAAPKIEKPKSGKPTSKVPTTTKQLRRAA
jgi:TetR/AcrR family acrAB operon transcriptional repressor